MTVQSIVGVIIQAWMAGMLVPFKQLRHMFLKCYSLDKKENEEK